MTTIEYVRRLPSYEIVKTPNPADTHIRGIINMLMPDLLPKLDEYTRGMYSEELNYTAFYKYERPITTELAIKEALLSDSYIYATRCHVEDELRDSFSVDAISMSQLDKVSYIGSSAAGFGYVGLKRDNYLIARAHATSNLANFNRWGTEFRFTPYKAFSCTQLALRADPKVRHVWGAPFHTILIEGTIAQPIIQNLQLKNQPIFIGRDMFKELPATIHRMMRDDNYAYCVDLSSFDSSVNVWFIECFFDFVKSTVRFPNIFSSSAVSYCREEVINTPVVMPDGKLYICRTGVPSGSYFTQMIDSYVNLILLRAAQLYHCERVLPTYVLGDDSLFVYRDPNLLDELENFFAKFNFVMNRKKSIVSKDPGEIIFLGHNFYGSRLTRDDFTLACLAVHTEDPVTTPDESVIRLCSLLYDSGYNSFFLLNLIKKASTLYGLPERLHHPYVQLFLLG